MTPVYLLIPTDITQVGDVSHKRYQPTQRHLLAVIPPDEVHILQCFKRSPRPREATNRKREDNQREAPSSNTRLPRSLAVGDLQPT